MATKVSCVPVMSYADDYVEPTGRVSVHTMLEFVDHTGRQRIRRVSLFTDYGASAAKAKLMLKQIRETNPNLNLGGRLIIDL